MGEVFSWRRVPSALAVLLGLLALAATLVDPAGSAALHQTSPGGPVAEWLVTLAVALPCTAVGVLLAARQQANPIGWLLLTLLLLTADPAGDYAMLDYRLHRGTLPLGWVGLLFLGGPLVIVLMAILLWLFPDGRLPAGRWHRVSVVLVTAGLLVGIAVLKYRLYDIDRIISRVISYLIITAVLAGVFAALVLFATSVLPVKAPVSVAAATLAAAALFNPLRRRVQHAVDGRFNRTRYNAEVVVASFTARLRQTVDLDTTQAELLSTVHQAFQPAHVSIWSAAKDGR